MLKAIPFPPSSEVVFSNCFSKSLAIWMQSVQGYIKRTSHQVRVTPLKGSPAHTEMKTMSFRINLEEMSAEGSVCSATEDAVVCMPGPQVALWEKKKAPCIHCHYPMVYGALYKHHIPSDGIWCYGWCFRTGSTIHNISSFAHSQPDIPLGRPPFYFAKKKTKLCLIFSFCIKLTVYKLRNLKKENLKKLKK